MTKVKWSAKKDQVGKPCLYCRRPMKSTALRDDPDPMVRGQCVSDEHIIPRVKFKGTGISPHHPDNVKWACQRCNSLRGSIDHQIFELFGQVILQQYPDLPNTHLRNALDQFLRSLAEIAIRNKKEARRAISLALLKLDDDLKRGY